MNEYLEILFWCLLVGGIWFGGISQLKLLRDKNKRLDIEVNV